MSPPDKFDDFLNLLGRLERGSIHFKLSRIRPESILVEVAVPGERWEIELMASGEWEVEVFRSDGGVRGAEALDELFRDHTD